MNNKKISFNEFLKICDVIIKRTGKDIRKSNDEILSQLGIVEVIDIQIPNGEYLNSSKSAQGIMRSLAGYFIRLGKHTNEDLLGSLYCTRTGEGNEKRKQISDGFWILTDYPVADCMKKCCNMVKKLDPNNIDKYYFLYSANDDALLTNTEKSEPIGTIQEDLKKYSKEDFLNDVYISEDMYDSLVSLIKNKKNVVLQGPPGVGKTFMSNRLAYSIMGKKDTSRIEFVQFHQNYSYEDFVLGYKPNETGFYLKKGVFYLFCKKAEKDKDRDYFFIIDEINRGNMSKIFGELLMLIERDYRGEEISLAYGEKDEKFSVPKNLYIIGLMNTADRSLAIIDYALRRRFSFVCMKPGFDTKGFTDYLNNLNNAKMNNLIKEIKNLNKAIEDDGSLGKGFVIGHSYFCGMTSDTCSNQIINEIVDFDILPTLSEYWFDNQDEYDKWELLLHGVVND